MNQVNQNHHDTFSIAIEPKVKAPGVAWQSLITFSQNLQTLLSRIDAKQTPLGKPTLAYDITDAKWKSALELSLTPRRIIEDAKLTHPMREFIEGVNTMESNNRLPVFFDEPEVKLTKRMLSPLHHNGIAQVTVTAEKKTLNIRSDLSDRAERLLRDETNQADREFTTIDGELRRIAIRGDGKRGEFQVFDRPSDRFVACRTDKEKLQEIAPLIGKRMRISGEARLAYDGRPKSIRLERYEVVETSNRPSLREIYEAGLRLQGDSVEMVRELRRA